MESSPPVVDKKAALELFDGDEELFVELSQMFLDEARTCLGHLRAALDADNAREVARYAHMLKGSAANICALPFKEMAANLEIAAENKDLSLAARLYTEFEQEFQRINVFLLEDGVS